MTEMKATRNGAYWKAEDGTLLSWDEDKEVFRSETTGEVFSVIRRITDDCVVIG